VLSKAVHYLREAGERSGARSANREAVAYFEEALAVLSETPETNESLTAALEIRLALGPQLSGLKGAASAEAERCYQGALALVERLGADASRFPALWGLWYVRYTRGEHPVALEAGARLLSIARSENDSGRLLEAHHSLWPTLFGMGRPLEAIDHAAQGIALYDRERHGKFAFLYAGHDPGACAHWHQGLGHWMLGYPQRALHALEAAGRVTKELGHPVTTGIGLWFDAWIHCMRGEQDLALACLDQMITLARMHGITLWLGVASAFMEVMQSKPTSAAAVIDQFERLRTIPYGTSWRRLTCLCVLAEASLGAGYAEPGLSILSSIEERERRAAMAPEILRIEGELILKRAQPSIAEATNRFREALAIARAREVRSFELRSATSLARLLAEQGRREEAYAALAGAYGWFTEGFDTADLRNAKALLDALS
jgi:tetratricopeptide (TPR) repeat protein